MKISEVIKSLSASNAAIKNTASSEPKEGWYPAYSASGQDVWLPDCRFTQKGIVVSAVGARCGKAFKADGKWNICANTHPLSVDETKALRDYCWYMINNEDWWIKGGTAQPFVKVKDSFNRDFNFPPISEQKMIVSRLDTIQALINQKQLQIKRLDELVKARFVEMFENDNMNEKTIEDVASFCSRGKSPKYVTKSKLKVINQACIYWDRFKFENVKYNEEDYDGDRIISNNDLLICSTGTGTLGRCNIFRAPDDSRYMADSHVTIIRLNGHILPEVFKAWFERPRTQEKLYSDCVSGSTNQIELSKEKLKNMNILVPPINLQKQFASFAKQVDKSKFAVQKSLEKTQLLFDSLMQEYFD